MKTVPMSNLSLQVPENNPFYYLFLYLLHQEWHSFKYFKMYINQKNSEDSLSSFRQIRCNVLYPCKQRLDTVSIFWSDKFECPHICYTRWIKSKYVDIGDLKFILINKNENFDICFISIEWHLQVEFISFWISKQIWLTNFK